MTVWALSLEPIKLSRVTKDLSPCQGGLGKCMCSVLAQGDLGPGSAERPGCTAQAGRGKGGGLRAVF